MTSPHPLTRRTGLRARLDKVVLFLLVGAAPLHAQQAPVARRTMERIGDAVYRFADGEKVSIVFAERSGITVVDPMNLPTARWLQGELASRFPGVPVRFVVFTHHHYERSGGAQAFGRSVETVAHEDFDAARLEARSSLPAGLVLLDGNANDRLEPQELQKHTDADVLADLDVNGDGGVTPDELFVHSESPKIRVGDRRTLRSGASGVDVQHMPRIHAPDMLVVHIPAERLVFASDVPAMLQGGYTFGGEDQAAVRGWLRRMASFDADTLLTGDGRTRPLADIRALSKYLEQLADAVSEAARRGLSLAATQEAVTMDFHRDTPYHAARLDQIASIYRHRVRLTYHVSGAATVSAVRLGAGYCDDTSACESDRLTYGGIGGVAVTRTHIGAQLEFHLNTEAGASRTALLYADWFNHRQTRAVLLLRRGRLKPTGTSVILLAGPTLVFANSRVVAVNRNGLVTSVSGGRKRFDLDRTMLGFTAGADLVLSGGERRFFVPLRLIVAPGGSQGGTRIGPRVAEAWPAALTLQAGFGLSWRTREPAP